jgi:hypothetical protein
MEMALRFAARGWKVFPLSPGKKTPRFPKGHRWGNGFKNATGDPAVIEAMWEEGGANCNIGIATGPESGLFIIDVDNKVGTMGAESNDRDLRVKIGIRKWRMTTTVSTASGGHHRYFKYPGGRHLLGSGSQMLSHGIDHKGIGGYVVGPGSVVNGVLYVMREEAGELAVVPPELIQCLRDSREPLGPPAPTGGAILSIGEAATFGELWAEVGITLKMGDHCYPCPWHYDTKPSLSINSTNEVWICHGCNRHGGHWRLWAQVRPESALPGPTTPRDDYTEAVLRRCDDLLGAGGSIGTSGTDIKVFAVMVSLGWTTGSLQVGASLRWLAEQAGCSAGTAGNAVKRLISGDLLVHVGRRDSLSVASMFRICDPLTRTVASSAHSYCLPSYGASISLRMRDSRPERIDQLDMGHDAFRWGALGSAMGTALHLQSVKKGSARNLHAALGTKSLSTIFRHLKMMQEAGVAINEDGIWTWVGPSNDYLMQYAQVSGTSGKGALAKIQHDLDRQGWQEVVNRLEERRDLADRNATSNAEHLDRGTNHLPITFPKDRALDRGIVSRGGDPVDIVTGEITEVPKDPANEGDAGC